MVPGAVATHFSVVGAKTCFGGRLPGVSVELFVFHLLVLSFRASNPCNEGAAGCRRCLGNAPGLRPDASKTPVPQSCPGLPQESVESKQGWRTQRPGRLHAELAVAGRRGGGRVRSSRVPWTKGSRRPACVEVRCNRWRYGDEGKGDGEAATDEEGRQRL